jgi:hypothetical protein
MSSHPEQKTDISQTNRVEQYQQIQKEAIELFSKKNKDYGDAFAEYGVIGVLVRMGDKIKRLQTITTKSIICVDDESLQDTLLDLHNYSAMALMLLREREANLNQQNKLNERLHHYVNNHSLFQE